MDGKELNEWVKRFFLEKNAPCNAFFLSLHCFWE